jgi:hypothetical protein
MRATVVSGRIGGGSKLDSAGNLIQGPLPVGRDRLLCGLADAAGRVEACPGPSCPFWEEGGALIPAGCMVERLGLQLEANPRLAHGLVQVRRKLDQATSRKDEAEARSLFYRLVPAVYPE